MTPVGHLAMGFAARPGSSKIPLGILLAASWLLDMLYMLFALLGIESAANLTQPGAFPCPWSHGLFMALVWSVLAGLAAFKVYHTRRAGVVIGLVVFSHWVLDFLSWNNAPLFFDGSPQVGLGLFHQFGAYTIVLELALLAAGLAVYLVHRRRIHQPSLAR